MPKALEVEARQAKLEDEEFKAMFKKMKKAPTSTAENTLVTVEDFMKAICKEARALELLFETVPKIKAPDSSDDEADDGLETDMFDFFNNIAQGKKDPLSDVQLTCAGNNATYK